MVGGFGGGPGGIRGLLDLIDQHGEAITVDLLNLGVRLHWLGTDRFSWADLSAWVARCPPTAFLYQAVHGPHYPIELRMNALLIELLRGANWQRSGGRGTKPKPIRWPWSTRDEIETFGAAVPIDDVRDFLVLRNGRAPVR